MKFMKTAMTLIAFLGAFHASADDIKAGEAVAIAAFNADSKVQAEIKENLESCCDTQLEKLTVVQVGDFTQNDEYFEADYLIIQGISSLAEHWSSSFSVVAQVKVSAKYTKKGDLTKLKAESVQLINLDPKK